MRKKSAIAGHVILALIPVLMFSLLNADVQAQDPFQMVVGNVSGVPGELVEIPIYIQTQEDSLDGFQISLFLSTMELAYFETDTVIQDNDTSYVCDFDTTGTLASGWEYIAARSTTGSGLDLRLSGISSIAAPHTPGIPTYTPGVLMLFYGRIRNDIPDTLTNRTAILYVAGGTSTRYSNENGLTISPVENINGSITVEQNPCDCGIWGDVNDDGAINPVDVVLMVNYVYMGWDMLTPLPACPYHVGDVNCDNGVNPVDVVFYVNYVYLGWNMFCPDPCIP